jgi:predicted O-methyltransferase YrrM
LQFARRLTWELDGKLKRRADAGPLALPLAPLQELIPETELTIGVSELRVEDGGTAPYERVCIAAITRCLRPRHVFEIGTFRGRTTALLVRNAAPEARVFTLDIEAEQARRLRIQPTGGDLKYINKAQIGEHIDGSGERGKITQLLGDSMTFDYRPHQGRCDLVFVDAAHSYDSVKSDTANAFKLLAPGGVILWHDYKEGCPGVVRALHEVRVAPELQHIAGTSLVAYGLTRRANQSKLSASPQPL